MLRDIVFILDEGATFNYGDTQVRTSLLEHLVADPTERILGIDAVDDETGQKLSWRATDDFDGKITWKDRIYDTRIPTINYEGIHERRVFLPKDNIGFAVCEGISVNGDNMLAIVHVPCGSGAEYSAHVDIDDVVFLSDKIVLEIVEGDVVSEEYDFTDMVLNSSYDQLALLSRDGVIEPDGPLLDLLVKYGVGTEESLSGKTMKVSSQIANYFGLLTNSTGEFDLESMKALGPDPVAECCHAHKLMISHQSQRKLTAHMK